MVDYAGACDRAALCATRWANPPYVLRCRRSTKRPSEQLYPGHREPRSAQRASGQILLQRLPILSVPSAVGFLTVEVRAHLLRKAHMVHDQPRFRALRLELEFHDRIESLWPHLNAPCLDNAPTGQKLNVSSRDYPTEARKCATRLGIDLCWRAAEPAK